MGTMNNRSLSFYLGLGKWLYRLVKERTDADNTYSIMDK